MRPLIPVLLILLLTVTPVFGKEGFSFKWSYGANKDLTSIAAMDVSKEGYLDSVMVGSLDNKVYVFNYSGILLGSYEGESTITSVASFVHDGDFKLNDGIAGSLDDYVYVFWRPYGQASFKTASHWWNYSTGDNVYAVGAFDWNESGQLEGVLAGTGNYADSEYGNIMAFAPNGSSLWNYSVSSKVTFFSIGDLDSDNKMSNVVAGSAKSVYVLDSEGALIWKYDFNDNVAASSYADFDIDGQKDDILVGAGSFVYAIDSHKQLLWKYDLKKNIASITPVDSDGDDVLDYFLVSAGTTFYAVKNQPSEGVISWEYDAGKEIKAHVGLDFDRDGSLDDVAFISKNYVYAYDFDFLYLPAVEISKTASSEEMSVGEKVTVTLNFENKGNGKAKELSFNDKVPDGFKLVAGNLSSGGMEIPAWKDNKVYYTLQAVGVGEYELPGATATLSDSYGNTYNIQSNKLKITVKEPKVEKADLTKPEGAPVLGVYRTLSRENVSAGDNLTVTVVLENLGSKPALTVNFEEVLPEGLVLVQGENTWKGALEPGEYKELAYVLEVGESGDDEMIHLEELTVYYRDDSGKVYQAVDDAKTIGVLRGKRDFGKIILILPLLLAIGGAALLYKKKMSGKKNVDPMLEEKFIQVYLKHQKKGERPTYEEMQKELGVDTSDVDGIANYVKKKMSSNPLDTLITKLKNSIPNLRK